MLLGRNPRKVKKLRLMPMSYFPFDGYFLLMWCGTIIFRKGNRAEVVRMMRSSEWQVMYRHESIHLEQAQRYRSWIIFYTLYLLYWLRNILRCRNFSQAYYEIPFEVEAYEKQNNN